MCFASHGWQIALELLPDGCDLNVRICTKHGVFSGNRRFRCGEKLARVRDGCGRRCFRVESVSICARAVTEVSQSLFLFSVQTVLLCFVTQCLQISVEWLRQGFSKGTCSSVLSCGWQAHWNCFTSWVRFEC